MNNVYEYKGCSISDSHPLMIKDIDGRKGIMTGYFSIFDTVDSDGDSIKKGAFAKTIQEQGPKSKKPRIKHIFNHDPSQPLGVIYELNEDNIGLAYESQLGTHNLGVDFIKMVDSGLITENSFGFRTIKFNQVKPWSEWKEGELARELTELKMWEGSNLSAWGANWRTFNNGLKSEKLVDITSKRIDLLVKAMRNGTFTDETFDMLEIELRQIQQLFIDLTKEQKQPPVQGTVEPVTTTQQPVVKSRNWGSLTQLLN